MNVNRRNFLKTSVLASAPFILPRGLWAASPSKQLNVGIVGCGVRGGAHSGFFLRSPQTRIRVVCDIWPERAQKLKQRIDKVQGDTSCKVVSDFREICQDPDIDIVTVAAPDHWHALVAIEAANHGKHLYLEKPLAYSIEEGRAVVDAVERNGVILQLGTQQRSMTTFQRAAYLAQNGHLGEVHTAYAISPPGPIGGDASDTEMPEGYDFDMFTGPAPETPWFKELAIRPATPGWYFTSVFGGGWVTAWGSHHVDCAQWALGKDHEAPVKVEVQGKYPETGVFDTAYSWYAEFTYVDGKKLIFCTSDRPECPKNAGNMLAVGTEASVAATRRENWSNKPALLERAWTLNDPMLQAVNGKKTDHAQNFVDAICRGTPLNAPVEIGHLSTTLCHLTNIGIEIQRPFEWDAKSESIRNDPLANRLLGRQMRAPWHL